MGSVEVKRTEEVTDEATGAVYTTTSTRHARMGNFDSFIGMPIRLAYTYTAPPLNDTSNGIGGGLSVYWLSNFWPSRTTDPTPQHNVGLMFFTSRNNARARVSAPVLSFGMQFNDLLTNKNDLPEWLPRLVYTMSVTVGLGGRN